MRPVYRPLQLALAAVGVVFLLVYPLAAVWPAGWQWHTGPPHDSEYFLMVVGLYATLGIFLLRAAGDPLAHTSLLWFTVWSSVVHAVVMAALAAGEPLHRGHLWGDVAGLLLVAVVLTVLLRRAVGARVAAQTT
ncbi:DUF6632 domain-containing protein [Georgenia satyanarayanai]|uniref:DUF6632 domain-containing protein n=1 Tax=Georgenia satyanarayanai TaxID=860221 RepID=UPI0012642B47|nr:DUF6632 domain-containing protein [Georgenia satyanarayanai]